MVSSVDIIVLMDVLIGIPERKTATEDSTATGMDIIITHTRDKAAYPINKIHNQRRGPMRCPRLLTI